MSAYQTIAFQQPVDGLISFSGQTSGRNPIRPALGGQIWTARIAALCGFAGAVLAQAAILALVARLVLDLDSVMLPNPTISALGLALGALATLASGLLSEPRRLVV